MSSPRLSTGGALVRFDGHLYRVERDHWDWSTYVVRVDG